MVDLAHDPDFQRLVAESDLAHNRTLSRYGSREAIDPLPQGAGEWFALRCQGNSERFAAEGLKQRNFVVYLPMIYLKERHGRGSMREVERPMFSTYLFLRCLPRPDHWDRARNVAGVRDLVGAGSPEVVPRGVIDTVRRAEACHATKTGRKALRWNLAEGSQAKVLRGPFAEFYATVTSAIDDHGRVMALVSVFGRASRVQFNADDLESL